MNISQSAKAISNQFEDIKGKLSFSISWSKKGKLLTENVIFLQEV